MYVSIFCISEHSLNFVSPTSVLEALKSIQYRLNMLFDIFSHFRRYFLGHLIWWFYYLEVLTYDVFGFCMYWYGSFSKLLDVIDLCAVLFVGLLYSTFLCTFKIASPYLLRWSNLVSIVVNLSGLRVCESGPILIFEFWITIFIIQKYMLYMSPFFSMGWFTVMGVVIILFSVYFTNLPEYPLDLL